MHRIEFEKHFLVELFLWVACSAFKLAWIVSQTITAHFYTQLTQFLANVCRIRLIFTIFFPTTQPFNDLFKVAKFTIPGTWQHPMRGTPTSRWATTTRSPSWSPRSGLGTSTRSRLRIPAAVVEGTNEASTSTLRRTERKSDWIFSSCTRSLYLCPDGYIYRSCSSQLFKKYLNKRSK